MSRRRYGDEFAAGDALGRNRSELEIAAAVSEAWDELADVIDDAQMRHVTRIESEFDQSRAGQLVWLAFLKRAKHRPSMIEVEEVPRYACPCGDTGLRLVDQGPPATYRPCEYCNRESYELWHGGHYEPGHRCGICMGKRRAPQAGARETIAEERAEDDARAITEELF